MLDVAFLVLVDVVFLVVDEVVLLLDVVFLVLEVVFDVLLVFTVPEEELRATLLPWGTTCTDVEYAVA